MRNLIDIAESLNTPTEIVRREGMAYAETLGVQLELDLHERGELMLGIWRNDAVKGSGAKVMLKVNELADQHGVTLILDVIRGEPKLVPYYWQFGYRGWTEGEDDTKERAEFESYRKEWEAFAATNPDEDDYCVICMVRRPQDAPVSEALREGVERVQVWSGATIPVHNNPSKIAFDNFTAQHRAIRGLLSQDGTDLWLWDAGMAVHPNIIQELGLGRHDCIAYTDGRWSGPVHADYADGYKPAIQRLTPYVSPKREYSDEELLRVLNDPDL